MEGYQTKVYPIKRGLYLFINPENGNTFVQYIQTTRMVNTAQMKSLSMDTFYRLSYPDGKNHTRITAVSYI